MCLRRKKIRDASRQNTVEMSSSCPLSVDIAVCRQCSVKMANGPRDAFCRKFQLSLALTFRCGFSL